MQQELPFYRSKTFHRKKIMVMFTAVFLALLFLMGRLVYLMDRKHRTSMRGNVILRRQEEKF